MKKVLSILCVAALLWAMTITAFAVDNTTNPAGTPNQSSPGKAVEALQKRSDALAKKLQFFQFKQSLEEKKAAIRQNKTSSSELVAQNIQLRKDIVDLLLAAKQNGGAISQDVQKQLKAYNQQIKDITSSLKETKGSINDIMAANRQNIKDMNYDAVNSAYSQVISIQQNRAEQLTKINSILKSMKSLLSTTA